MGMAGLPFSLASVSCVAAPSSIRATSCDAQHRAVRIGAQDDVAEFLGRGQAALGLQVDLELGGIADGPGADAADGRLGVLRFDGGDDVRGREVELDHPLGAEPDAHGIVERAEHGGRTDAGDARERVQHVDGDVVADEQRVLAGVGAGEDDEFQDGGGLFFDRDALQLHFRGQPRQGGLHAVVDVDRVDIGIGAEREADDELVAAVVGAVGFHVDHLVDAVDLRLQRLGHGGFHHRRGGAGVARGDLDLWGHDVRELRDRDAGERDQAGQGGDDGDDDRQPGPVDEDGAEHVSVRGWG